MHKPDGGVRLCIDLRDVNSKIIVEHYPMPNIHKMLFALSSVESISRILEQKVFFFALPEYPSVLRPCHPCSNA